jgi:AraC-like DNA-binding protein
MEETSTSRNIGKILDFDDKDLPVKIVYWQNNSYPIQKQLNHPEIEFLFIMHGSGQYFIKGASYEFNKNSVIIFHKNEGHNYISSQDYSIEKISLMFSPNLFTYNSTINKIITYLQSFYHIMLSENDGIKAGIIFEEIAQDFQNKEKLWKESIKSGIENLLFFIFRNSSANVIKSSSNNPIVQEVIDYIRQNFSKTPSLNLISKHIYVSPYHLSRLFSRHAGMGYKAYLIHLQIVEAKRLLEETDNLISEIAFDVGFSELSSFNRNFKSVSGISPSEFRRLCKTFKHIISEQKGGIN